MKKTLILLLGVFMNMPAYSSELRVHYKRISADYDGWSLWVWNSSKNAPGMEKNFSGKDEFGVYLDINLKSDNLEAEKIGFLPKYGKWENKDGSDRILNYSGQKEIFIMEGENAVFDKKPDLVWRILGAKFISGKKLNIYFNSKVNKKFAIESVKAVYCENKKMDFTIEAEDKNSFAEINLKTQISEDDVIGNKCSLTLFNSEKMYIDQGDFFYTEEFNYKGKLGVLFENGKTIFRVFSPNSLKLNLILKESYDAASKQNIEMLKRDKGIWEYETDKNLTGKCYFYEAQYQDKKLIGQDPYARAVVADSICSVITNEKQDVFPSPSFDLSKLVIYEMSVRDITADENISVENKKMYLGLAQDGAYHKKYPQIKAGLAHLKELGVNAVHILPFQDFEANEDDGEYNWGYMPVNFNTPEGSYAVNRKSEVKIKELKEMISALHKNGIKVIADVVYNHTAETKEKIYNFNAIAYDYFYRKKGDNSYYNGSGCGNEFKSESPMGRKFIIDSLKYWVENYKVDGFRFDLMGLIDEETAFEIVRSLKEIKPDIIIYGEPWAAGETPVKGVKKGVQKGKNFSVFNDDLRDALKGSVFNLKKEAYIYDGSKREAVMAGIKGSIDSFAQNPKETINYVSCHDNHTLFDRIDIADKDRTFEDKVRMDKLAQSVVFVSQGIPFLHSGEEMLRTKKGEENSYNLGDDINLIDYSRKKDYYEVFSYYRDLISMRKNHPAFLLDSAESVRKNLKFYEELGIAVSSPLIAFILDGRDVNDSWGKIAVLINPTKNAFMFNLPEGKWKTRFDDKGLIEKEQIKEGFINVNPISIAVLSSH